MPHGLLHHEFGQLWMNFFKSMDVPVVESGATTKSILDRGTVLSMDESCLPLKVYLGHVDSLLDTCSHIFVPRIVQYHPHYYLCAKFAGLPDIVQNTFRLSPNRLLNPNIEEGSTAAGMQAVHAVCKSLGLSPMTGQKAYYHALAEWRNRPQQTNNQAMKAKVAVVGHSYILEDSFFSQDIMRSFLSEGVTIVTPKSIPNKKMYELAKKFRNDIYWQLSAKLAGAVRFFCHQDDIAGIILVSSFGCGPDSMVNEYLEHHVLQASDKPYMILNIDEHTGKAGLLTRVEAFWDMVERRLKT
jgi:predicted nucleotide-binding protein (sugar kinase/HSP70/actin superfamily)